MKNFVTLPRAQWKEWRRVLFVRGPQKTWEIKDFGENDTELDHFNIGAIGGVIAPNKEIARSWILGATANTLIDGDKPKLDFHVLLKSESGIKSYAIIVSISNSGEILDVVTGVVWTDDSRSSSFWRDHCPLPPEHLDWLKETVTILAKKCYSLSLARSVQNDGTDKSNKENQLGL